MGAMPPHEFEPFEPLRPQQVTADTNDLQELADKLMAGAQVGDLRYAKVGASEAVWPDSIEIENTDMVCAFEIQCGNPTHTEDPGQDPEGPCRNKVITTFLSRLPPPVAITVLHDFLHTLMATQDHDASRN